LEMGSEMQLVHKLDLTWAVELDSELEIVWGCALDYELDTWWGCVLDSMSESVLGGVLATEWDNNYLYNYMYRNPCSNFLRFVSFLSPYILKRKYPKTCHNNICVSTILCMSLCGCIDYPFLHERMPNFARCCVIEVLVHFSDVY